MQGTVIDAMLKHNRFRPNIKGYFVKFLFNLKQLIEDCHDIPKTHCRKVPFQVPHEKCKPVPEKECIEVPYQVRIFLI